MIVVCIDADPAVRQAVAAARETLPKLCETPVFTSGHDALAFLKTHGADAAVLGTQLPDMRGLSLGAKLREMQPDIPLIFLSENADCAVDAFALHASGYILKPVAADRLAGEILYALRGRPDRLQTRVVAKTFGDFEVFLDGSPVRFARSKAKELLAFLVDRQGSGVRRPEIFSALWENGTYDRAMQKQLDVIIRSLRDTLRRNGIGDILEMQNGFLRILPEKLDCDLYSFLRGDRSAVRAYRGEYMNAYAWARLTEGYISRGRR